MIPGYTDGAELTCAQCSSDVGPTYVRWGKSSCPSGGTLLYAGLAAGGGSGRNNGANNNYEPLGGNGFNYQCLHSDPQYDRVEAGLNTGGRAGVGG